MLFKKILQHVAEKEEIELPPEFKFARVKIKKRLDEDTKKWDDRLEEKRRKRSEA